MLDEIQNGYIKNYKAKDIRDIMSIIPQSLYRLNKTDIEKVSNVLYKAFRDDPFVNVFIPSPDKISRYFPPMMKFISEYGIRYGEVVSTSDAINDVSIWFRLKTVKTSVLKALLTGYLRFKRSVSKEIMNRFTHVVIVLEEIHVSIINSPHWYLNFIAVEPQQQKKGHGTKLLTSMLRHVDNETLNCYLEAWVEKNVEWYQKHGFKIMSEINIFDCNGWAMLREQ